MLSNIVYKDGYGSLFTFMDISSGDEFNNGQVLTFAMLNVSLSNVTQLQPSPLIYYGGIYSERF